MSEQTERIVADFRNGTRFEHGMIVNALLDVADQRDELATAVENFLQWCDVSNWQSPFDKELRTALAKVRPE